jgi:hypothetical protein
MPNKKINIIANIVLPIVVASVTVVLFLMFQPEQPTALFYLNLGYTIVLEMVFFGYLNLLYSKAKGISTPLLAIFGVYDIYYVLFGTIWMFLYSLLLSNFVSLKVYIAALVVLTLIWILISVLTAQTDSNYKQTIDKLKNDGQTLNFYVQKITLLASRYENLCAEKGIIYKTDSNNKTALDRLKNKISFLTPNVLQNEATVAQLSSLLSKCETIIEETENATPDLYKNTQNKMQRFVNDAVAELDMLKNLTKK